MKRRIASKLNERQYQWIHELAAEGFNSTEIGKYVGAAPHSVYNIIKNKLQYVAPKYEKPIVKEKEPEPVFDHEFEKAGGYFCIDKYTKLYNQKY